MYVGVGRFLDVVVGNFFFVFGVGVVYYGVFVVVFIMVVEMFLRVDVIVVFVGVFDFEVIELIFDD